MIGRPSFALQCRDPPEEIVRGLRHDAVQAGSALPPGPAQHRVSLAGAGLAVGEHAAVVAVEHGVHQRAGTVLVDVVLRAAAAKHSVVAPTLAVALNAHAVAALLTDARTRLAPRNTGPDAHGNVDRVQGLAHCF